MKRKVVRRKRRVQRKRKFVRRKRTNRSGLVGSKFCLDGTITVTGGTGGYYASAISIADLVGASPALASYLSLYQQYRITKLKWNFYPRGVSNITTWADNAVHGGRAVTTIDYDDVVLPTSFNHLERTYGAKKHSLNHPFSRYFTPSVNTATEGTPTSTVVATAPRRRVWLKSTSTGVEHYGIKMGLTAPGPNTAKYYVDICITAYVQFRFPQ